MVGSRFWFVFNHCLDFYGATCEVSDSAFPLIGISCEEEFVRPALDKGRTSRGSQLCRIQARSKHVMPRAYWCSERVLLETSDMRMVRPLPTPASLKVVLCFDVWPMPGRGGLVML